MLRSGAVGAVSNVAGGIARNVHDGKPVTVGSVAKDAGGYLRMLLYRADSI